MYVKETPSLTDTKLIAKLCRGYDIVIGDLNLNVSNLEDKKKLDIISSSSLDLSVHLSHICKTLICFESVFLRFSPVNAHFLPLKVG